MATSVQDSIRAFSASVGITSFRSQDGKSTVYSFNDDSMDNERCLEPRVSKWCAYMTSRDPFGGCHLTIENVALVQIASVRRAIENYAQEMRRDPEAKSVWVNFRLPVSLAMVGGMLPDEFQVGKPGNGESNIIIDQQQNQLRAWKWIGKEPCSIPPGATHNIGATALLYDSDPEVEKVLLVVNKRRPKAWNLPGGNFDQKKDSSPLDTALREAMEETGIELDREDAAQRAKLVGQVQFPKNLFAAAINQTWSVAKEGLSSLFLGKTDGEIIEREWVDLGAIFNSGEFKGRTIGPEIQAAVRATINQLGAQQVFENKFMIVHAIVPSAA